jgi:hypothetical protein
MFRLFHLDVAFVPIYGYTRMFQAYVLNILDVFRIMLQVFHLDVAYVALVIHACFKNMFQVFHLFQNVCCKCFI